MCGGVVTGGGLLLHRVYFFLLEFLFLGVKCAEFLLLVERGVQLLRVGCCC